jgi:hypothetical protein
MTSIPSAEEMSLQHAQESLRDRYDPDNPAHDYREQMRHLDNGICRALHALQYRTTGRDPKMSGYAYAEIPQWVLLQWLGYNRMAAQAIEARRAETGTGSVHESAVAKPCAQPPQGPSS